MSCSMSIVIPAFNEAKRLPGYLCAIRDYLTQTHIASEVIVVDDGSSDDTVSLLNQMTEYWEELRVVRHRENRGKGAAVRSGVMSALGDIVLFCDADGATPIHQEKRLRESLVGVDVAVGSRRKVDVGVQCQRDAMRDVGGRVFSRLARSLLKVPVLDTQCGFKMFRQDVARTLFGALVETRFAFDVELLAMAVAREYVIKEVAVEWTEIEGGKTRLVRDGTQMLFSLLRIRRRVNGMRRGLQVFDNLPNRGVLPPLSRTKASARKAIRS